MRNTVALLFILSGLATGVLWFNHQPAQSAGDERALNGSYTVEMNVTFGEGHQPYIQMPHNIKLTLTSSIDLSPVFLGPPPFVAVVSGGIDSYFRKLDGGTWEFHMTGHGTVAGYQNVSVEFSGEFDANGTLTGTYSMGKNYELPGGYAILYQVKNAVHSTFTPTITNTPFPTDTPTNTPLPTLEVCAVAGNSCAPTDTPAPPTLPPTATRTPTATPQAEPPTATPAPRNGDCNHDGTTNAIDALHVLQYTAGLVPWPGDCADVNRSGTKNTVDVTLILQYVADLINHLPWP